MQKIEPQIIGRRFRCSVRGSGNFDRVQLDLACGHKVDMPAKLAPSGGANIGTSADKYYCHQCQTAQ
jgi:hypothetical protein